MLRQRWASAVPGFTVVEILIVVIVIGILSSLVIVGYNGIRVAALKAAAQEDLHNVGTAMQLVNAETGTYPSTLPSSITPSSNLTLTVVRGGTFTTYGTLTAVQNGVLLANICQDLIDEGVGKGLNQGGQMQQYITGCGNWNHGSMQVTGWSSKVWITPVANTQLQAYADAFTTSDTWNKSQETAVKNFYTQLVSRHAQRGGTFPVTSFWDSWAAPGNGGVMKEALPATTQTVTVYCVEARSTADTSRVWHIDESGVIAEGACL